ncbi:MAG TPA: VOC family protein [Patescibacteria group bacterium]|nr:VOC family protein [Patescibacteria group bacterium]
MTLTGLTFHHLGLAVKDDAAALTMLEALGYTPQERIYDPAQNVHLRLCLSATQPTVEIVQPGPEGKSPVDGIIAKYNELIYHNCYETPDLAATLAQLGELGLRALPLGERKPAILFGGRHVSFYRIMGFGIIELLERN